MKTLVIHPQDESTDFLELIYQDLDCDVIGDYDLSPDDITRLVPNYDRIICLGHGCPEGLFSHHYDILVGEEHVELLRDKKLICIWCNADQFMKEHNLTGFYSGMFISEVGEARVFGVPCTQDGVTHSNDLFAKYLGKFIDGEERLDKLKKKYYISGDRVVEFNRSRLYDTGK